MKKIKVIIATGNVDMDDDKIIIDSVNAPKLAVPVTLNFDQSKVIGIADIDVDGNNIVATLMVDGNDLKMLTPAISFRTKKEDLKFMNGKGDPYFEINNLNIESIGLCSSPNADPNVKSIGEQLKDQNK